MKYTDAHLSDENLMLEIDGELHPLTGPRTIIGRGSEADITVDDNGI